jgi:ATP/maltotriose-dependent transcriptional regulator MalT
MSAPVLATKLFIPSLRSNAVTRPRLITRLNEGLQAGRKLALISAPAGFGKTTLVTVSIDQAGLIGLLRHPHGLGLQFLSIT